MQAILALDQGTTSSRALIFDRSGKILSVSQREFRQLYPQPGWVEHDPLEIWASQIETAREALSASGLSSRDIAAVGITNQRETTIIWDRKTGQPIGNAIVWQDRRTAGLCEDLVRAGHAGFIQSKTGLVVDAYFSGSKIRWMLDHIPGARDKAERGELAFGTVDSWLVWQLTHRKLHITDVSNASRSMLFNLERADWDDELLSLLGIPRSLLPEVRSSSEVYGNTAEGVFDGPIPIAGIAGDQQAALFGQNCLSNGMVKNTYGTGCFMLMNIGSEPKPSRHRLLTTTAWRLGNEAVCDFAYEGSIFIAGAVVQWLRDGLGAIKQSSDVERLALSVPDCGGVVLVPAFAGLGAPHWDPHARGTIMGITRGTTTAHIARAALEGIAYQVADVLDAMREDSSIAIKQLRVDGGAAANNLLMQFQADMLQAPVVRPKIIETTALGAAYLAGLAVGFWEDQEELKRVWQADAVFEPKMSADQAESYRARWRTALERSKNWESTV
ncbi:MAG: glycerol kinase GlpK [Pirellulales bacterium]